jgi:hypothetical protein
MKIRNFFSIENLPWLSLALVLAGSLKHLAAAFASVDGDIVMGWVQAIAIDVGLFTLAYSIRQRRAEKRSTKSVWFGVSMFTTISIYGNWSYGLEAINSLPDWITATKPYILYASLPILALFLSEFLSDNRHFATNVHDNLRQSDATKQDKTPDKIRQIASTNDDKMSDKTRQLATKPGRPKVQDRRDKVQSLLSKGLSEGDIADKIGVSPRTIQRDVLALSENGRH